MDENKVIPQLLERLKNDDEFISDKDEREKFVEAFKLILIEI